MLRGTLLGVACALAIQVAAATPSFAQSFAQLPFIPLAEGTPEDRAACEGDARRYCRDAIPDNMRVLACLQQNRQRISRACRGVLEKYGQ